MWYKKCQTQGWFTLERVGLDNDVHSLLENIHLLCLIVYQNTFLLQTLHACFFIQPKEM